jgi:hypothetical protein
MKHIDKYTALHLDEYNGVYSVVQGYAKDDEFKPSWVTEEWGKEKLPKTLPKRIKIGDKAKAIEVAVWMYRTLTGKDIEDTPF